MSNLSKKEKKVLEYFKKKIKASRAVKKPLVIGMVGLVGSGKTRVSKLLSKELGFPVVSGDDIRKKLRAEKESYDNTREITRRLVANLLESDSGIIIDSDHIDAGKRNNLKKIAKDGGAKVLFVRSVCDMDESFKRMIGDKYPKSGFFDGAYDKVREAWRRTPLHYSWSKDKGGHFHVKKLPFVFEEVDTTFEDKMKKKIKAVARKLSRIAK